ncbi:MAG: methyltransferase domain-containing protein [Amphritea sp.]
MSEATENQVFQLSCPVCKSPLNQQDNNLRCANGHSFDAARQGYWNLLLANQKRSKDPGDNAAMVQARRTFLALDYYAPLANSVSQQVAHLLRGRSEAQALDMGCGEGYYTHQMQQRLESDSIPIPLAGLDISKHAVKAACRLNKSILWIVASGANIPVADHSLDLVSVLFSRLMPEEFGRVIKPGGSLLVAYPGENHLIELRELIYDDVRQSAFNPAEVLGDAFKITDKQTVHYQFELSNQAEIQQLLAMTPHGWRITQTAKDKLSFQKTLSLTLDVQLVTFTRQDSQQPTGKADL